MKKRSLLVSLALVFLLLFGSVASAFTDLQESPEGDKIQALQTKGVVNGYGGVLFKGNNNMTNAEAVHLIVKSFDLSLAAFLFIKEPLASDYFERVPDRAWYSQSFVIAQVNGLELPKDIDPKADISREAFAHYLLKALLLKGDYAFTEMYFEIKDAKDVNPDYANSLQVLLNGHIISLDKDGSFRPKQAIKRSEAAAMVFQALKFVEEHAVAEEPGIPDGEKENPFLKDPVTFTVEKINDQVQKVTLSWGEKPHPGYGLSITQITFTGEKTAAVHYKLHTPIPGRMYPQVIVYPTADTYVPAGYEIVLVEDR